MKLSLSLKNGMEERGTHNELLMKGGTYARYYHMQFEGLDFDEQTREHYIPDNRKARL